MEKDTPFPEEVKCNFFDYLINGIESSKNNNNSKLTWGDIHDNRFLKIKKTCIMCKPRNTCDLCKKECNINNCFILFIIKVINGKI